jgi:hypothetical protein
MKKSKPGSFIGQSKAIKKPWEFDASNADQRAGPSAAAGDYYGTGVRNPIGRLRDDTMGYRPATKKQLGKPPKSVV